jgi:tetratricopeptide (TPR) repeat protein
LIPPSGQPSGQPSSGQPSQAQPRNPYLANRPSPGGRPTYVPPQQPPTDYRPRPQTPREPQQQPPNVGPVRGGFDRPLRGDSGYYDHGHDRRGYRGDHWRRDRHYGYAPYRPRSSFSISIGTHFGSPYYYAPPPAYIASPFTYYSVAYCAPAYSGYYYSPFPRPVYSYHYYPYYYPRSAFSIGFSSGSFRGHYSWLYDYRFAHVPAYPVVYSTTLVRPAVIHVVEPVYVTSPTLATSTVASSGWFGSSSVGSSGSTGVVLPPPQRVEEYPAAQAPQPRVTTGAELGHTYLQLGDGESAFRVLMDHIAAYPNDTQAIRAIGLAYLLMGEAENGVRQIGRAYRQSPWLASRPLIGLLAPQDHGYALDIATQVAVQQNSADAWLTVAVLMQAEERFGAARQAIQRARNAGLSPELADGFLGALPGGGN